MGKPARTREPGPLPLLTAILEGRPNLPAARCTGRHELFDDPVDDEDRAYRTAAAARLCRTCTHITRCPDSVAAQPHQETA